MFLYNNEYEGELMIEFFQYTISGGVYVIYFIICIICALACVGVIAEVDAENQIEIEKKKYHLRAEKEEQEASQRIAANEARRKEFAGEEVESQVTTPQSTIAPQPVASQSPLIDEGNAITDEMLKEIEADDVPDVLVIG